MSSLRVGLLLMQGHITDLALVRRLCDLRLAGKHRSAGENPRTMRPEKPVSVTRSRQGIGDGVVRLQ